MQLADLLAGLFPAGHAVKAREDGTVLGEAHAPDGTPLAVIGIAHDTPLGVDAAAVLAGAVLAALRKSDQRSILVLVDSSSQRMSRRDELLGLNEYLGHLIKALSVAAGLGHPTLGLLYGHSAAGAFLATALATRRLVALPDSHPEVMDLPSMARVTKLPLATLQTMARSTPVFAPGLAAFSETGAVDEIWTADRPLDAQLAAALAAARTPAPDSRDQRGSTRGRPVAAGIAAAVRAEAGRPRTA